MYIPAHFAADIAGVVAGLSARGDDRNATAVEHANENREKHSRQQGPDLEPERDTRTVRP